MKELMLASGVVIVMAFLFYLFYKSSRSVKSYNKIPGKEIYIHPDKYDRYIAIKNISEDEIPRQLIDYSNTVNSSNQNFTFKIKTRDNYSIIECDKELPQIHYYNLISKISEKFDTIGYSKSLYSESDSFIVSFDEDNPGGDTLVGVFGNSENFFVVISDLVAEVSKNIELKFSSLKEFSDNFKLNELLSCEVVEESIIEL